MTSTDIDRIWQHLEWIASEPRPEESERLEKCRQYCEQHLRDAGWKCDREPFRAVSPNETSLSGINIVCGHPEMGSQAATFVLGAHLDSRAETPGADDNASAVAVLLEVARLIGPKIAAAEASDVQTTLELVVFDLEEHGMLGGAHHAVQCRRRQRHLYGMVSLEMLGYCSNEPGSQQFPPELADRYPEIGNFIGIVGNQNSGQLIQQFVKAMQRVPGLPVEFLQVPQNGMAFPPTRLSDHSPFWDEGFPALMITDTSYMRNPHYHEPTDTPDTLDREFLHKVADGVLAATESIVFAPGGSSGSPGVADV